MAPTRYQFGSDVRRCKQRAKPVVLDFVREIRMVERRVEGQQCGTSNDGEHVSSFKENGLNSSWAAGARTPRMRVCYFGGVRSGSWSRPSRSLSHSCSIQPTVDRW